MVNFLLDRAFSVEREVELPAAEDNPPPKKNPL